MSLETEVANVLRMPPAPRVAFKVATIEVNVERMGRVAAAIDQGDIGVVIGDTGTMGAGYTAPRPGPGEKKFGFITLKSEAVPQSPLGRASVFHECVHALRVVAGYKFTDENDDEVVAYLADALFLKCLGHNSVGGAAEDVAIYTAAFKVIDAFQMHIYKNKALRWSDLKELRQAIDENSHYRPSR
jgi:hypothetical protein